MTDEEYNEVCDAHENEGLGYLFLNKGSPVDDLEYKEKFQKVEEALKEYAIYLNKIKDNLKSNRDFFL